MWYSTVLHFPYLKNDQLVLILTGPSFNGMFRNKTLACVLSEYEFNIDMVIRQ